MLRRLITTNNILSIFIGLYLSLIIFFQFEFDLYLAFLLPVLTIFFTVIFSKIFKFITNINLKPEGVEKPKEYFYYILLIVVFSFISIICNYPATATNDSVNQFNQALTNNYSDWHPLFHTLIFFKFPVLIYKGYISCSIVQALFAGAILLYFCKFCRKYFLNFKSTVLLLTFILSNPIFLKMNSTLWKDIPFSFSMMIGTMFLIEIFISDGKWLKKGLNRVLFFAMSFGIVFFRHNGIFSFALMMLLLIFFYKENRKFLTIFFVSFIVLRMVLTGPVYSCLKIEKNGGVGEMLGVPLNQISYIYNMGGKISATESKSISKIAPLDYLKNYFRKDSFNNIKWNGKYNSEYVSKHYKKVLKLWGKLVIKNPKLAISSYIHVTKPIWGIKQTLNFVDYSPNKSISSRLLVNYNSILTNSFLRILIIDVGEGLFLIIVSLCIVISKYKKNFKAYIPYVLPISNVFIIMLLITGGEVRFVYSSILCSYPLMLYALITVKNKKALKGALIIQFIKSIIVGAIAAIVNISFLYIFTELFKINYIFSNICSFVLGLIVNYVLSKKIVFVNENIDNKKLEFTVYSIIGVAGLVLDTIILFLLVDRIKIYYMIAKVISTFLVFVWNFGARKLFYSILGGKL